MNWKGNGRYSTGTCLEGLRKITNILCPEEKLAGLEPEIPNTKDS
jgi:hypothetical protein